MIKSFKHKGLKQYFETGKTTGIQSNHLKKLKMQLVAIDTAEVIEDINLPGYCLHKLKGNRNSIWSISVNGNWRVTFKFEEGNAYILPKSRYRKHIDSASP
jgi:proteic killer suppression protein